MTFSFLSDILQTWTDGGWMMIPLALLALFIYTFAADLFFTLSQSNYRRVPEEKWSQWIKEPGQGEGQIGAILAYACEGATSLNDIRDRFGEIRAAEIPRIDRRLQFLHVLVTAAPLAGLLGTVLGMLATFEGLAGGGGKTIDLVSAGISTALITTQVGLVIAIPGYFLASAIRRRRDEYSAFLARLETLSFRHFRTEHRH